MKHLLLISALALTVSLAADDSDRLLSIDHFVRITSAVPASASGWL